VVAGGVNTGLDLEDAAQSTLIEQKGVTELPLNQRNLNAGLRYSYYRDPTEWILNSDNFDPALYSPAQAPTIDNGGYICLKAPCAGGGTPNAAYPAQWHHHSRAELAVWQSHGLAAEPEFCAAFRIRPNTNINSTSFGVISGNGEPRKMQIAAKIHF
jgi:hypothetical protein